MGKLALQFVSWVVTWMKERYPPLPLPLDVCGRWESPSQLPEVMNTWSSPAADRVWILHLAGTTL